MYRLSLVIPIYNVEKYLIECLDSIFAQLEESVQVIFVNDGSTDNSANLLVESIARIGKQQCSQIVCLDQTNKGLSEARNAGIERAEGEYIGFVDSDDKLLPNGVRLILDAISLFQTDIIDFDFLTSENKYICIYGGDGEEKSNVFLNNQWYAWARVFKKELIGNKRFYPGIYFEDIEFVPKMYINAMTVHHIDYPLYWYRTNSHGISQSSDSTVVLKSLSDLEHLLNLYFDKIELEPQLNGHVFLHIYYMICHNSCAKISYAKAIHYVRMYSHMAVKVQYNIHRRASLRKMLFIRYPRSYLLLYKLFIFLR